MARSRRGRGEGGVYRRDDGSWRGQVSLGYDRQTGKRRRVSVSGATKQAVLDEIARLRLRHRRGGVEPSAEPLRVYLERWLDSLEVSTSTRTSYEHIVRRYLVPRLGGVELGRLCPLDVIDTLGDLDGVGDRTRLLCYQVLHRAVEQAVEWELVEANPVSRVKRPRHRPERGRALASETIRRLLEVEHRHRPLWRCAIVTGMRRGELLALQWPDLDVEAGTISVRHTLRRVDGELVRCAPKTARSERMVALPAAVVAELEAGRGTSAWLFPSATGGPLDPDNALRSLQSTLRRLGLPPHTFHDLRHTAATLMAEAGVSASVAQAVLGHASARTTLDVYTRASLAAQRRAIEAAAGLID